MDKNTLQTAIILDTKYIRPGRLSEITDDDVQSILKRTMWDNPDMASWYEGDRPITPDDDLALRSARKVIMKRLSPPANKDLSLGK